MGAKISTQVILLIVCCVASFISARTIYLQPQPAPDNTYQLKYENLQKKIQQIHDVDFEEYVQLKEQKEKYLKADEILGKIFLVFLAEAGLKLSQKNIQQLRGQGISLPKEPEKAVADTAETAPCKPTKGAFGSETKEDVAWLKNEKIFGADKLSEDEAKSLEIKDLFSVLKKAQPMGMATAQKINGVFDGSITFDGPPFLWMMQLELEVTGENSSGVVEGKFKVALSEPNKEPFSNSNSDGNQDQFLVTENSQAIFLKIKAKNKDNYLQLYITDGNRKLVGNYYEAVTLDQFKKIGTVSLSRR